MAKTTPYRYAKSRGLNSQQIYRYCLRQGAPYTREENGTIYVDEVEFDEWRRKHLEQQQVAS